MVPLVSVQLLASPLGLLTSGTTNDFYFLLGYFLFPSAESIWLMLSIYILLKCNLANESLYGCWTGWESQSYLIETTDHCQGCCH